MVNVNDCPNSGVFRTVKAASAVLSFVAVALLAAYMFKRRRHVRVQGLEAVDGTLLVFAFGFSSTMCLLCACLSQLTRRHQYALLTQSCSSRTHTQTTSSGTL